MKNFYQSLRIQRHIIGKTAEDAALDHLLKHGLILVERNFRCKGGELDLIMRDGATLVFIEVRKRSDMQYGGAAASITRTKQMRLVLAAQVYLLRYAALPACRFDVVAFDGNTLHWLKNAIEEPL